MNTKPPIQNNNPYLNPGGGNVPPAGNPQQPYYGGQPARKSGGVNVGLIVGGLAALVIVVGGLVAFLMYALNRDSDAGQRVDNESRQQRKENIQNAFDGTVKQAAEDSPISEKEIEQVFADLKVACDSQSRIKFKQVFDYKEMLNCVEERSDFDMPRGFDWEEFKSGAIGSLDSNFAQMIVQFTHDACQVNMIQPLESPGRVLVYARLHHFEAGSSVKARFWLFRNKGRVMIYDFEEIESAHRITSALVNFLRTDVSSNLTVAKAERIKANTARLNQVRDAVALGDLPRAKQLISSIRQQDLLTPQKSIFLILKATIELGDENYSTALATCDQLRRANPDAIIHFLFTAKANYGLGNYQESIKNAEKFQEFAGVDSDALYWIGASQVELGQKEIAIETLRKSMDDNPNAFESLYELVLILDDDPVGELKTRFKKIVNKKYCFEILTDAFKSHGRDDLVKALDEVYRAGEPG